MPDKINSVALRAVANEPGTGRAVWRPRQGEEKAWAPDERTRPQP